jgi:CBS domain-containing protein
VKGKPPKELHANMVTVRQLLRSKPADLWSVGPETSVYEALELMAEKNIGAVLVLDDGELAGILTERDYARNGILKGRLSKETSVGELMTDVVCYVRPEQTVDDCMALMTDKRVRHLPVLENERLIAIVSIGDVVKKTIEEQEYTIQQLENYITGKR